MSQFDVSPLCSSIKQPIGLHSLPAFNQTTARALFIADCASKTHIIHHKLRSRRVTVERPKADKSETRRVDISIEIEASEARIAIHFSSFAISRGDKSPPRTASASSSPGSHLGFANANGTVAISQHVKPILARVLACIREANETFGGKRGGAGREGRGRARGEERDGRKRDERVPNVGACIRRLRGCASRRIACEPLRRSRGSAPAVSREAISCGTCTDGSQPTSQPRPISIKRKSEESAGTRRRSRGTRRNAEKRESRQAGTRHRFKIRLPLPRMRGYLQILQRYRVRYPRLRAGIG